jgi:hypothetical protein
MEAVSLVSDPRFNTECTEKCGGKFENGSGMNRNGAEKTQTEILRPA